MKTPKQKLEKELDKLWSLKVREKCECELCGQRGDIKCFDAHHIRRRGNKSTRWDLDNGVCLCKGCHRFKVHMDTLTASELLDKLKERRTKEWYYGLVRKSYEIKKWTMKELEELKDNLLNN